MVVVNLHVFSFLTFVIIITCYADLHLVLIQKEINNKQNISINYLKFIEVLVAVFFFSFPSFKDDCNYTINFIITTLLIFVAIRYLLLCFIFKTSTKLHHIKINIYERKENLLFYPCNVHKLKHNAL